MIARSLWQFVLLTVAAAGCWWLITGWGQPLAGVLWAVGAGVACAAGAVLLRTSAVGRLTWKNRVAGSLIPWGWRLSAGKLWPVPLVSWGVWVLVWAAVAVLTPQPGGDPLTTWDVVVRLALGFAWGGDALALAHLVGVLLGHSQNGSGGRSLRRIAGVLAAIVAASVALHLFGFTGLAVLVAGGPIALVGIGYGLFLAVLLIFRRNSRWN